MRHSWRRGLLAASMLFVTAEAQAQSATSSGPGAVFVIRRQRGGLNARIGELRGAIDADFW